MDINGNSMEGGDFEPEGWSAFDDHGAPQCLSPRDIGGE